jgi:hypothetical protein
MQLEAETIETVVYCFFIVIGLYLVVIASLYYKYKSKALIWFIVQSLFLAKALFKFTDLMQRKPEYPEFMASEKNSLALGITGVLWAASMICMIIGLLFIMKERDKKQSNI